MIRLRQQISEKSKISGFDDIPISSCTQIAKSLYDNFNENRFLLLLALLNKYCRIYDRSNECVVKGNSCYMDIDDFYSVFVNTVYQSIYDYKYETTGNFQGYVRNRIIYTFAECTKQAFFHVTGNIPKEKRHEKDRKVICGEYIFDKLGSVGTDESENNILKRTIYKYVEKLPEYHRNIINYMYFSDDYGVKKVREVASHFNISEKKAYSDVKKAYDMLKKFGVPTVEEFAETVNNSNVFDFYDYDYDKYLQNSILDENSYIPTYWHSTYNSDRYKYHFLTSDYNENRMPSYNFY